MQALALDPEFSLSMVLQPGDIQWVHNPTMLHTRDGFVDGEVPRPPPAPLVLSLPTLVQVPQCHRPPARSTQPTSVITPP